jgi:hypothetical protein
MPIDASVDQTDARNTPGFNGADRHILSVLTCDQTRDLLVVSWKTRMRIALRRGVVVSICGKDSDRRGERGYLAMLFGCSWSLDWS